MSITERIRNIIDQLEKDNKYNYYKAAADAIQSEHPTADADDSTVTPEEGEHAEENRDYIEENVSEGVDTKEEVTERNLGELGEELTGNEPALAGEEPPIEPKETPDDVETEHPATAEKQSFVQKVKRASLSELFNAVDVLLNDIAKSRMTKAGSEQNFRKLSEAGKIQVLLTAVKKAAEETADLVAGEEAARAEERPEHMPSGNKNLEDDARRITEQLESLPKNEAARIVAEAVSDFFEKNPDKAEELVQKLIESGVLPEDIGELVNVEGTEKQSADESDDVENKKKDDDKHKNESERVNVSDEDVLDQLKQLSPEEAEEVVRQAASEFFDENPDKLRELQDLMGGLKPKEKAESESNEDDVDEAAKSLLDSLIGEEEPKEKEEEKVDLSEVPPPPNTPPEEVKESSDEKIANEALCALVELGLTVKHLEKCANPIARKLAKHLADHQRKGKFRLTAAKEGSNDRVIRDYMKSYIAELYKRSR